MTVSNISTVIHPVLSHPITYSLFTHSLFTYSPNHLFPIHLFSYYPITFLSPFSPLHSLDTILISHIIKIEIVNIIWRFFNDYVLVSEAGLLVSVQTYKLERIASRSGRRTPRNAVI